MKITKVVLSILLMCCVCIAQAQVLTTYSIKSSTADMLVDWVDKDTMVFVTIDDVLLMPNYNMFSRDNNPYIAFIDDIISRAKYSEDFKDLLEKWYSQRRLRFVESEWLEYINKLKAKGAMVFGICDIDLPLKDIEKKRYVEVKTQGVSFTEEINNKNVLVLGQLDNWISVFYQGILFSGHLGSAKTIETFMKTTNIVPKKIVFFGMRENTVRQVDLILRPFNMNYYTVIYLATKEFKPEINHALIRFQQLHFLETGELIEDDKLNETLSKYEQTSQR